MSAPSNCPFCSLSEERIVWQSEYVIAIHDGYPVTEGHTLLIPREHVETYFDASLELQQAIWKALDAVKVQLDAEYAPDGYNVGFNAGPAAGQTVPHLHVHVIPRKGGDVPDPRGGVRGVIPSKQNYSHAFGALPRFVPVEEDGEAFPEALVQAVGLAEEVDIIVAFVQPSGLDALEVALHDAMERGTRVRLVTGDYLGSTHPDALRRMLTWATTWDAFEPFFYLTKGKGTFHPKSYIFANGTDGIAYVGSSNLSRTGLSRGVEWNLVTSSSLQPQQFAAVREHFDAAREVAVPLTAAVIDAYAKRARVTVGVENAAEPNEERLPPLTPHGVQNEALTRLQASRDEDAKRALVVMATGLGKTFLSAFDAQKVEAERILFVAHREEILSQAMKTWSRVFPDSTQGMFGAGHKKPDVDQVFATVQTLANRYKEYEPDHFDYVVVDEFHHAAAATYRKLLAHFEPQFLLGLTATPDRMDGASLLELCHDNVPYEVGVARGIHDGLLVPFRYFGVKDSVDYEPIPWRNRKFDNEELTAAVNTKERAQQALREYLKHAPAAGRKALVFCCNQAHADFMAEFLRRHDVNAAAVHSGPTGAPRAQSVEDLSAGRLEAICAVDIFNEGLDIPDINVVLMLRPTESSIVFLQQLGRGLRRSGDHKPHLTVVDFIGNHRSFLAKPKALLSLLGESVPAGAALRVLKQGDLQLPPGCSVDIETEAIDILDKVSRLGTTDHLVYEYEVFRDSHGRRPTAAELLASGVSVASLKKHYDTWFEFVEVRGDLSELEKEVVATHRQWLGDLWRTQMTKSYKMVTLQVLLEADQLFGSLPLDVLASRSRQLLLDDPVLKLELRDLKPDEQSGEAFERYWRRNPIDAWVGAKGTKRKWFGSQDGAFSSRLEVAEQHAISLMNLTSELVELRLTDHRRKLRPRLGEESPAIVMRVSHSDGKPILRFDRARQPGIPAPGDVEVFVDGEPHLLKFVKIAVNVATKVPSTVNVLPQLMRSWFGPHAGHPGTHHEVRLQRLDGKWTLTRETEDVDEVALVIPFPALDYYERLDVACGAFKGQYEHGEEKRQLHVAASVELDSKKHFIVRADGDSMNGPPLPIQDGDLVLCEWLTATAPEEVEGRVTLLAGTDQNGTPIAALKVPVRQDGAWLLRSQNPEHADRPLPAGSRLEPVARPLEVVTEAEGPRLWARYKRDEVVRLFGQTPSRYWQQGHFDIELPDGGHSLLFINLRKGADVPLDQRYADRFLAPDKLQWESQAKTKTTHQKARNLIEQPQTGRPIHAFVRYNDDDPFTYCGSLRYERHAREQPVRFWFKLNDPLPKGLFEAWRLA